LGKKRVQKKAETFGPQGGLLLAIGLVVIWQKEMQKNGGKPLTRKGFAFGKRILEAVSNKSHINDKCFCITKKALRMAENPGAQGKGL